MDVGDVDDEPIRRHYREQAAQHELSPTSTMADQTTRELEVRAITACVRHALVGSTDGQRVGEVGCGNGHLLATLRSEFPQLRLSGIDFSPEMVALARRRALSSCEVEVGDATRLAWADGSLDIAITERCIINLLDADAQDQAVAELRRVVRPGGHLVLVEAFTDGLENLNQARDELGLPPTEVPFHNRWLDKERILRALDLGFEPIEATGRDDDLPPVNFLSSHYFVSRVLYPSVTQREVLYNTHFVQFFKFLPPQGQYSPIQLLFLRRGA